MTDFDPLTLTSGLDVKNNKTGVVIMLKMKNISLYCCLHFWAEHSQDHPVGWMGISCVATFSPLEQEPSINSCTKTSLGPERLQLACTRRAQAHCVRRGPEDLCLLGNRYSNPCWPTLNCAQAKNNSSVGQINLLTMEPSYHSHTQVPWLKIVWKKSHKKHG